MHVTTSITQAQSIGVGLKNILTHRDNLALVNYERNMLLLSFHCHRKRLGNGHVILNYSINIHSLHRQLQFRSLKTLAGRGDSLIHIIIILSLEFFKRLNGKSNKRLGNFNTGACLSIHHPRHKSDLSLTHRNQNCWILESVVGCGFVKA